jgi:hypothetical protein
MVFERKQTKLKLLWNAGIVRGDDIDSVWCDCWKVFRKMTCPGDKINGLEKNNKNKNIIDVLYRSEVDIHMSLSLVV